MTTPYLSVEISDYYTATIVPDNAKSHPATTFSNASIGNSLTPPSQPAQRPSPFNKFRNAISNRMFHHQRQSHQQHHQQQQQLHQQQQQEQEHFASQQHFLKPQPQFMQQPLRSSLKKQQQSMEPQSITQQQMRKYMQPQQIRHSLKLQQMMQSLKPQQMTMQQQQQEEQQPQLLQVQPQHRIQQTIQILDGLQQSLLPLPTSESETQLDNVESTTSSTSINTITNQVPKRHHRRRFVKAIIPGSGTKKKNRSNSAREYRNKRAISCPLFMINEKIDEDDEDENRRSSERRQSDHDICPRPPKRKSSLIIDLQLELGLIIDSEEFK